MAARGLGPRVRPGEGNQGQMQPWGLQAGPRWWDRAGDEQGSQAPGLGLAVDHQGVQLELELSGANTRASAGGSCQGQGVSPSHELLQRCPRVSRGKGAAPSCAVCELPESWQPNPQQWGGHVQGPPSSPTSR